MSPPHLLIARFRARPAPAFRAAVLLLALSTAGAAWSESAPLKKIPPAIDPGSFEELVFLIDDEPAPAPDPGAGDPACLGLRVDATESGPMFSDSFESGGISAWGSDLLHVTSGHLVDLRIRVEIETGFAGDHVLHARLTTPKGHHYQTLSSPIAGTPSSAGTTRRVDGFPRPLPVRAAPGEGPLVVDFQLPIAGTSVQNRALWGQWRVEAFLDDQAVPCTDETSFILAR